jgi:hypothetical protein
MAITSRGNFGVVQGTATAATLILSVSATTVSAGNLAILVIGADNSSTTNGDNSEVSSVTDSGGNTWTKAREHTNGNAAASAGAMVSMWYTKPTTTLTAGAGGGTITVTFVSTRNARAATGWVYAIGSSTPTIAASTATATDVLPLGTANLSTALTSREYLFVRGDAFEGDIATYSTTAAYSSLSWVLAPAGSGFLTAAGEFKIATTTSAMSTPVIGFNYDNASVLVAFYESAAAAGTLIYNLALTGVGA